MNVRIVILLAGLTLVAGYADAVAFFGLGVFTANMTGNTVLLGAAIAARFVPHLPVASGIELPAISILCFAAGAAGAAAILRGETGRPPTRTILVMGFAVAALFGGAALYHMGRLGAAHTAPVVALLSMVMGIQSVVAVRAGVPGVSTVYVTGTLETAAADFAGAPHGRAQRAQGWPNLVTWALYLAGACAGTVGEHVLGPAALWPAAVVVALLLPVL
jgi:uncharacterized membrane protein YoaK (UPF0700 family)